VRELGTISNAEAIKAYPVEIQGVVTYSDPEWGLLFVHDSTGSTYINVHGTKFRYPLGSRVRVTGFTDSGDVGPIVAHAKIKILGPGQPPPPELKSLGDLDAGVADSHLVVTEGVLRPCHETWTRVCFRIVDGKTQAWAVVPELSGPAAQKLVGAFAHVKGVSGVRLNGENKHRGVIIFVNDLNDIVVEDPTLPAPFSSAPMPIGNLTLTTNQRFVRLTHIRGKVTWVSALGFFVQDNSGTIFVESEKPVAVRAGSSVDLAGFPGSGEMGLVLTDATVRMAPIQSNIANIVPVELTAAEVIKRSFYGIPVRLKARLISQSSNAKGFVYQLDDGEQRFTANLLRSDAEREVVGLQRNSVLELTGVAVMHKGTPEWPDSLLILIASPSDIVVLGNNSWLTLQRGIAIFGVMIVCVAAPLLWVRTLRQTVCKQTAMIRARLENELQLETKHRRLFERNLAAVFIWRPDGVIVDCNMAFVNMLGFQSCVELLGQCYWELEIDQVQREKLRTELKHEALSNREASLRRLDGVTVYLLTNITPVDTPEGTVYETTAIDVTQLRHHQAELQKARDAAVHDSLNDLLTGLPNRRLLSDKLAALMERTMCENGKFALLYLDLDGFKLVNDSLGHPVGDAVLVQVAERLRSRIREQDILARLSGDEFVVILDRLHAKEDATLVAENLLIALANPFQVKGRELAIGASIGITIFPEDATDAEELIKEADSAMYIAKREGKNRVVSFTPEIGSAIHEKLNLEHQLRGAIHRNEIFLHYQPEFSLDNNRLVRFEALARWTNPCFGQIPPVKFIPIAEECGLIVALGGYVMEMACTEALRWQQISSHPVQVAVNVSTIQFRRKGFVEEVSAILDRTGLNPELLQLELTESVMMSGADSSIEIINRLHSLGISLAVDDFGTGYSNLSYLPSMSFDALKIDRSFVINLDNQPKGESMIRTLVALARNIGMRIIVEGVEKQQQLDLIRSLGVDEVQGYLLGRPTANPIDDFLRKQPKAVLQEPVALPAIVAR
jgi:diguanylate cyclase (GGDEF)-like protein/PAS domain S-box-containing protein